MTLGTDSELIVRHAAKQHDCYAAFVSDDRSEARYSGCTGKIERGDTYIECMDFAPAYHSGNRYCVPCAIAEFGVDPGFIEAKR